jgi:hypothetical protein
LRRRILELCGFKGLERNEKVKRANEILKSAELKQSICNQIMGATYKDIERTMIAVLNERQLSPLQEEENELKELAPEKFDPTVSFKVNQDVSDRKKPISYRSITKEECIALMAASKAPCEKEVPTPMVDYPTYTRAQVEEMMARHYKHTEE